MQKWMHQKNRKTKALHEQQAVEWDKKTESLSFKLHPLNRQEGHQKYLKLTYLLLNFFCNKTNR